MIAQSKQFREFYAISLTSAYDDSGTDHPIMVCRMRIGDLTPQLMTNPFQVPWRREHVMSLIMTLALDSRPAIIGIDAPLGFPYLKTESYFPGHPSSPEGLASLWGRITRTSTRETKLQAEQFLSDEEFGPWFATIEGEGKHYEPRLRVCEETLPEILREQSLFDLRHNYARTRAGLAAMRMIQLLRLSCGPHLAIWPKDRPRLGQTTILEYNKATFWHTAALTLSESSTLEGLNMALKSFQMQPVILDSEIEIKQTYLDTMLGAAGLQVFFNQTEAWLPREMNEAVARSEGWTFGLC